MMVCAVCSLRAPVRADPLNPLEFPSLGTVTLASGAYTIDTSATPPMLTGPGTNLSGTVSAAGIAVFRFDDLLVNGGAVLTAPADAEGKLMRPVALVAGGDLTFAGTLDASGARGGDGTRTDPGIGGAGRFGGADGTGGVATKPGGVAGSINSVDPAMRLSGGSGGEGGLSAGTGGGHGGGGGGGGGAIELGALGTLTLTGSTITVHGGDGGTGGYHGTQEGGSGLGAGGGGGSGGAVLLHGSTMTLGGTFDARGGSGGQGRGNGDNGGGGSIAIQATAMPDSHGTSITGGFTDQDGHQRRGIRFARPALTPVNLDLGNVPIGTSITVAMTIRNTGDEGSFLNGQFPVASAPFARVGPGIFTGIEGGESIACEYTFAPSAIGSFDQEIVFLCNAGPARVKISGTGVGVPPTRLPSQRNTP